MQNKLKSSAAELSNSEALEMILVGIEEDIILSFRSTPPEKLGELQQELKAIDTLRGKIESQLLTYLGDKA